MALGSFFSRLRGKRFSAPLAPDQAFVAIGDLHGRRDLLDAMLRQVEIDGAQAAVIFVGDYVDRGPDAAGVLAMVQDLTTAQPQRYTALMGNHERMMLSFLDQPVAEGRRWLRYGGVQTLASFGIDTLSERSGPKDLKDGAEELRAAMPPGQLDWLRTLPARWMSGNIAVVHAGADPSRPIEEQPNGTLIWGHEDFARNPRRDGVWVIHGHTIVETACAEGGRIAVDTGAYYTNRLSAVSVDPSGAHRFLTVTA